MSEIKTCEQYVLAKLEENEERLDAMGEQYQDLKAKYISLQDIYDTLLKELTKHLVMYVDPDGLRRVEFESVWEKYDKEDFDALVRVIHGKGTVRVEREDE